MKLSTCLFATLAMTLPVGIAAAQPSSDSPPGEPQPTRPEPPATDPLAPMTRSEPAAPVRPVVEPMASNDEDPRPTDFAIGIGIGYKFPQSLETPNQASVRFRLPGGLTFEPILTLASTEDKTDDGNGNIVSNTTSDLGIGLLARIPIVKHRKGFDLDLIASAGIDSSKVDPMGDNNNTTTTTISLGWGLGVDYWITRHWQLSVTASNPLFDQQRVEMETSASTPNTAETKTSYGLVFKPVVTAMLHLYN